jgi:hypothetical protein
MSMQDYQTLTGPEHYRKAQRLVSPPRSGADPDPTEVAMAQVHALLALVSSVALFAAAAGAPVPNEWRTALSWDVKP